MSADGRISAEKPLAGAVLCCTSVSPDLRSQYADYALQMGAEHKLDLTSDVTHLLVGDTDTLKYKYVAREREDVKVLRPAFVDAVRSQWMQARPFDLEALEADHRLAPFHGLKICITGFDDMNFRAQLQKNVVENGGQYSGDLTKEVTHLVAARPEGKKYEYATQWQKKVVSLKWYKDTLTRGMQLDESRYHPSKPIDEQGIGAWNHRPQPQSQLGKRSRADECTVAPPRKLRRTASSRLGSQNENLWTDIVGGGAFNVEVGAKSSLRPTKSMSALDAESHHANAPAALPAMPGYYQGKYFAIKGFSKHEEAVLCKIITSNGGVVVNSTDDLPALNEPAVEARLLLVPYQAPRERLPLSDRMDVVSELWLELCMERKAYVLPSDYPYASVLSQTKPAGFSKLVIATSGFPGIQLKHTSKIVELLGAKYSQVLNESVSVLVCKAGTDGSQIKMKMQRAQAWGIPVVSDEWLYSCLRNNRKQPFEAHLLQRSCAIVALDKILGPDVTKPGEGKEYQDHAQESRGKSKTEINRQAATTQGGLSQEKACKSVRRQAGPALLEPARVHRYHQDQVDDAGVTGPCSERDVLAESNETGPLREMSPNCPTKECIEKRPKKRLFRTFNGSNSFTDENRPPPDTKPPSNEEDSAAPARGIPNARTLNGEIQDLLNIQAKSKATAEAMEGGPRQKKLIGRALSNLSNSSVRRSRANSAGSISTDGVGSEIGAVSGKFQDKLDSTGPRSFTGRAKLRLLEAASTSIELGDPGLYGDEIMRREEEEEPPALTQLVYDDPEEAIMLREKLAAKRRQRSKLGQKDDDPKPEKPREPRRIMDDVVLASAGWAVGRRTRQAGKERSPGGLQDF